MRIVIIVGKEGYISQTDPKETVIIKNIEKIDIQWEHVHTQPAVLALAIINEKKYPPTEWYSHRNLCRAFVNSVASSALAQIHLRLISAPWGKKIAHKIRIFHSPVIIINLSAKGALTQKSSLIFMRVLFFCPKIFAHWTRILLFRYYSLCYRLQDTLPKVQNLRKGICANYN